MARILIIPQFGSSGGTRTYLKSLLEYYRLKKDQVTLMLPNAQWDQEVEEWCQGFADPAFISQPLVFFRPKLIWYLARVLALITDALAFYFIYFKTKPDLVFISDGNLNRFFFVPFLIRKPVISLYHTVLSEPRSRLMKRMMLSLPSTHSTFVSVSQFAQEKLISNQFGRLVNLSRFTCIYNCLPDVISFKKPVLPQVILSVGLCTEIKNPFLFIEIAERCPEYEFIWVGEGPLLDECRKRIVEKGLIHIKFVGQQSNVESFYEEAHLYLHTTRDDNLPYSVIDALRRKLPVVSTSVGGLPELVFEGENGFLIFPGQDLSGSFVKRIKSILENKVLYSKMSHRSFEVFQSTFSQLKWTEEMNRLHSRLLLQK